MLAKEKARKMKKDVRGSGRGSKRKVKKKNENVLLWYVRKINQLLRYTPYRFMKFRFSSSIITSSFPWHWMRLFFTHFKSLYCYSFDTFFLGIFSRVWTVKDGMFVSDQMNQIFFCWFIPKTYQRNSFVKIFMILNRKSCFQNEELIS